MQNLGVNSSQILVQSAKQQLGADRLLGAAQNVKNDKSVAAAQDFEAMFISEMIKPMFETIEVDDNFGGGKGEEVFRGMLVQQYGKNIAAQGGIGLAHFVQDELLKAQAGQGTAQTQTGETQTEGKVEGKVEAGADQNLIKNMDEIKTMNTQNLKFKTTGEI